MDTQPARTIHVEAHRLAAAAGFPNNPRLPLLIYRQALRGTDSDAAGEVQVLLESHGWDGSWQNGVFDYHHYHSNTHEVLAVCAGSARVQFGGPAGLVVEVEAGDVAVLPAGTGHKCVESSPDFLVQFQATCCTRG
jgi:uncharacterized protein YjlB